MQEYKDYLQCFNEYKNKNLISYFHLPSDSTC